jgi:hypothetical protein
MTARENAMSNTISGTAAKPLAPSPLDKATKAQEGEGAGSVNAQQKASLNSSVVQASLSVAISAGNDPLALVLKTAITGINDALEADFGKDAIQNAAGQDNSAEATAERIVSLSTAFYDAYRKQNGLEDSEATRAQFIDVIRGGFESGFKEAQDILAGLNVLNGDVAAGIDKTYELVQKGYDAFLKPGAPAEAKPDQV